MKLTTYAAIERSPNAATPHSIRLRYGQAGRLVDTLTPDEARKLARHLLAIANAADKANGVRS